VKKYQWILSIILFLGLMGFACDQKIDISVVKENPTASGPQTEPINKEDYVEIYYVADNLGSDESGDGSIQKPWASINFSLSQISTASAENRIAILISAGDYSKSTIQMKECVDLYGGFSEKDWKRDITKYVSALSGDGERRIIISADNARLDGFYLTSGIIRGKGAGIFCDGVSPQITNNTFYRNKTLKPVPWKPKFIHETAHDGGAIYCENGASPLIKNNLFIKNQTENGRGAAIAMSNNCEGQIINNVFIENVAGMDDPMRSSDGGAISVFDWCNTEIEGNVILGNHADSKNDGGGIFIALWSSATVAKNIFVDNWSGDDAGALFVGGQEHRYESPLDPLPLKEEFFVSIKENTFLGNSHGGNISGAMRFTMESRGEFIDNIVSLSNGIYFQRSEVCILNNTILENFLFIETKEGLKKGKISNNTIWGDFSIKTEVAITNNNIKDGYPGEGNYSQDPIFKNDGFDITAEGLSYHPRKFYTEVYNSQYKFKPSSLIGRVAHAGGKWGVVRSNDEHSLTVWGDLSAEIQWTILPTYSLAKM
jgi:hypothetical protein